VREVRFGQTCPKGRLMKSVNPDRLPLTYMTFRSVGLSSGKGAHSHYPYTVVIWCYDLCRRSYSQTPERLSVCAITFYATLLFLLQVNNSTSPTRLYDSSPVTEVRTLTPCVDIPCKVNPNRKRPFS